VKNNVRKSTSRKKARGRSRTNPRLDHGRQKNKRVRESRVAKRRNTIRVEKSDQGGRGYKSHQKLKSGRRHRRRIVRQGSSEGKMLPTNGKDQKS